MRFATRRCHSPRGTDAIGGGRVAGRFGALTGAGMQLNEASSTCRVCGQRHQIVSLRAGERARCVRCSSLLATASDKSQQHMAKAFALAAFCLAVPVGFLPIVTLSKFGDSRSSFVTSGVDALWAQGSVALSIWVLICGVAAPLCFLVLLAALWLPNVIGVSEKKIQRVYRVAHWIQRWSMPEVHVLAVFVAFFKLGDLVSVSIEPGLWCYAAASFALLMAWRRARFAAEAGDVLEFGGRAR